MDSLNIKKAVPKVSVVVPSYNHEKFLPRALGSVLQQTYKDYEIRIIDDASTDQSVKVIKAFADQHPEIPIHWSVHEKNQGGVITLNDLVECAQGEYVALINSDDLWLEGKLEQQVAFLDEHPEVGAVFTHAVVVDDSGTPLKKTIGFPNDVFMQPNRSRGKWLRRMFYELNCLCHPSVLIRKSVYDQIGLYDPRLRQLPDFHMWIRVLKHTEIFVIQEPLVHLRIHTSNTSKVTTESIARNLNEMTFILAEFFDGMPNDVLIDGFKDNFRMPNAARGIALDCERVFLYFTPNFVFKSLYAHVGIQKLFCLLKDPAARAILEKEYQFDYEAFFKLTGTKFLDEILLASSFYFSRPPKEKGAPAVYTAPTDQLPRELTDARLIPAYDLPPLTLRDVLSAIKRYLVQKVSGIPVIYSALAKVWHWIRKLMHKRA